MYNVNAVNMLVRSLLVYLLDKHLFCKRVYPKFWAFQQIMLNKSDEHSIK